ncbi:hypothetical protein ACFV6Z_10075 [Streptomyces sp. NPDC059818]|uniref:hypothetical protein n=1 Tax=Streptomyces sp. NPDC059818 TaxID=3346962 RepID=UPI00364CC63C
MSAHNVPTDGQEPAHAPTPGTLMVDMARANRIGEFRGLAGPYWSLRPICGGQEREAEPEHVRPADSIERLRAQNTRCNARSRGEVL